MLRAVLLTVCFASAALAEQPDVPRLADGTVDVAAVMSSFHAVSGTANNRAADTFEGTLLGNEFKASVSTDPEDDGSTLTIVSAGLSTEATFLGTVLLTDLVCLQRNLRPAPVKWKETAVEIEGGWQVALECLSKNDSASG